eukprot:2757957-Lingulodinium_polyedra.AAC.1
MLYAKNHAALWALVETCSYDRVRSEALVRQGASPEAATAEADGWLRQARAWRMVLRESHKAAPT